MAADCLFCRIAAGALPADVVDRGPGVLAIRDIAPRAPVHVLVLPERHVTSVHDPEADDAMLAALFSLARRVAEAEGIADGYRVATNVGARGGQTVGHLHLHVLGGRQLGHIDSAG
jgi:histidine triad (HIT) family protein